MKDLAKFVKLYKSLGIELKVNKDDVGDPYILIGEGTYADDEMSKSKFFEGYAGFYSVIRFDKSGRFISQEFYE